MYFFYTLKIKLKFNLFIIYTKAKMSDINPLGRLVLKIGAISIFSGVTTLTLRFKDLNPEIVVAYVLWGGSKPTKMDALQGQY